jgi:hypothetical protein
MRVVAGLSYWPWIIGAGCSFVLAFFVWPRVLRARNDTGAINLVTLTNIGLPGSAALLTVLTGLIEGADTGLLVSRGVWGILDFMGVLAFSGAFVGFFGQLAGLKVADSIHKWKGRSP